MFKRIVNKINRTFFPPQKPSPPKYNVVKGEKCEMDGSSILVTLNNGKIILQGENYLGRNVEMGTGGLINIGYGTSIQDRCILLEDVEIGNYCVFAPNVYISSGRHYYDLKPNYYIKDQDKLVSNDPELSKKHSKKVTVGDDCWLGINSVIMPGVTIGRGCVIGANSVVTKDLEPFSVVAGAPAKLIKKRLDFIPKTSINFDNENDLPNFYKGFFLDAESRNFYKEMQGIAAGPDFTCYLSKEGKTLSLEIGTLWPGEIKVSYNNQEKAIEKQLTTIEFQAGQDPYHHFTVKGFAAQHKRSVIVKSVTIKK